MEHVETNWRKVKRTIFGSSVNETRGGLRVSPKIDVKFHNVTIIAKGVVDHSNVYPL